MLHFYTFSSSSRSVSSNYVHVCVYVVCISKRECQTSRHGPGLILMQAHGVGLRLGDNCHSEEWMAWELSSSSVASHHAVHHIGLMTGHPLRRNKSY